MISFGCFGFGLDRLKVDRVRISHVLLEHYLAIVHLQDAYRHQGEGNRKHDVDPAQMETQGLGGLEPVHLVKNEINKLVFTGLDLNGCVNYTILAADNRNYDICLISDAVLAKSDSLTKAKLNEFKQTGYEVISSNEYFNIIHN